MLRLWAVVSYQLGLSGQLLGQQKSSEVCLFTHPHLAAYLTSCLMLCLEQFLDIITGLPSKGLHCTIFPHSPHPHPRRPDQKCSSREPRKSRPLQRSPPRNRSPVPRRKRGMCRVLRSSFGLPCLLPSGLEPLRRFQREMDKAKLRLKSL